MNPTSNALTDAEKVTFLQETLGMIVSAWLHAEGGHIERVLERAADARLDGRRVLNNHDLITLAMLLTNIKDAERRELARQQQADRDPGDPCVDVFLSPTEPRNRATKEYPMSDLLVHRVKWFDDKKGYGFILHPDGDLFFHYSHIRAHGFQTAAEGQLVAYTRTTRPGKGDAATDVHPIDSGATCALCKAQPVTVAIAGPKPFDVPHLFCSEGCHAAWTAASFTPPQA